MNVTQKINILPALKGYVNTILLIERNKCNFDYGVDVVEPNGSAKLVLSLDNSILSKYNNELFFTKPNKIVFVGIFDAPFSIEWIANQPSRILVVELSPAGAYRILKINQEEHVNNFCLCHDLQGRVIHQLEELLSSESDVHRKVERLQHYLQHTVFNTERDLAFDFCIDQIMQTNGSITVKELERKTGYSARWLNMKFKQKLGISPKIYASIVRFQTVLNHIAVTGNLDAQFHLKYYYDQPHFIKEFKRYSGLTPGAFSRAALM